MPPTSPSTPAVGGGGVLADQADAGVEHLGKTILEALP
jgi:hypothetical protein